MKKHISHIVKTMHDDLKDAKMLFNYAQDAEKENDKEMEYFFASRAKQRMTDFFESHSLVEEIAEKHSNDNEMFDCMHSAIFEQAEKLKQEMREYNI